MIPALIQPVDLSHSLPGPGNENDSGFWPDPLKQKTNAIKKSNSPFITVYFFKVMKDSNILQIIMHYAPLQGTIQSK